MTVYAIVVTIALAFISGVGAHSWWEDFLANREEVRAKKSDEQQMDEAIALVSDELNATVVSTEVNR